MSTELPPIPPKRYFTIGEVSELCAVKPYVLRYWEQEFSQLRPMKRRGNRRYYQHEEVLLIRRIRELLYEQRFTISGARDRLAESVLQAAALRSAALSAESLISAANGSAEAVADDAQAAGPADAADARGGMNAFSAPSAEALACTPVDVRRELQSIRRLLSD